MVYYSDCVFSPYVHSNSTQHRRVHPIVDHSAGGRQHSSRCVGMQLDLSFLSEAVPTSPKILDNIGVVCLDTWYGLRGITQL